MTFAPFFYNLEAGPLIHEVMPALRLEGVETVRASLLAEYATIGTNSFSTCMDGAAMYNA